MTTDTDKIADVLGCPRSNVAKYWPKVRACLESLGMSSDDVLIAALATIRVECPPFKPIHEYGGTDYLNAHYDTRTDLGNTPEKDGDGAKYAGRGFIQITGKSNYEHYGKALGIDLVSDPDRALEADTAAAIFAAYFHEHRIGSFASRGDWVKVRRLVNGGSNGLNDFLKYVTELKEVTK